MAEKKEKKPRTPAQIEAQKRNSFKKGQSGNPAGRTPVHPDVKEAFKALTFTARDTLFDVMVNGKNDASRVAAAVAALNRGWGAPTQAVEVDVTHKQDWSALLNALDAHTAAKTLVGIAEVPLVIEAELLEKPDDPN
ncbi:hypothetical protein AS026_19525 [Rhizobium altiplani]|uniref:DUF5681 domain-containing protein n=1 Tax=Rhizobium altiplani TaxID=1864509 RepID=A0A109J7M8_9HYPH|nr:hypothetical protein [Rhizobium altiplani]KWV43861.1 hypothetical protein AS026_19525 [Rhizobium altiplani]